MKLFDYIFYKITKTYFKLDGRTGTTGIAAVTLVQGLLLCDILFLVILLLSLGDLTKYKKEITFTFAIIILALFALNFYRYKDKYNKLKSKWKNQGEFKSLLGDILVILSIIIPFILIPIIVNS